MQNLIDLKFIGLACWAQWRQCTCMSLLTQSKLFVLHTCPLLLVSLNSLSQVKLWEPTPAGNWKQITYITIELEVIRYSKKHLNLNLNFYLVDPVPQKCYNLIVKILSSLISSLVGLLAWLHCISIAEVWVQILYRPDFFSGTIFNTVMFITAKIIFILFS